MTLTFADTDAIAKPIPGSVDGFPPTLLLQIDGGTLAVERMNSSDAWIPIDGSPFADGSMKVFSVISKGHQLRFTAESSSVIADFERL